MYLSIGDAVKVAINYATGERWVDEVSVPSTYKKVAINPVSGEILQGDGTSAPTALSLSMPLAKTTSTGVSDANKWTKMISGHLDAQYANSAYEFLIGGNGSGGTQFSRGLLRLRVKQQSPFGSQPLVALDLVDGADIDNTDFVIVVTSVAGPTTWELWASCPISYSDISLTQLWGEDGSGGITLLSAQGWNASITSAGTNYYCSTSGDVPTGVINLWSTNTAPTGFLLCNGAAVSRTTYAGLFGVIGTTYGTGDGSTTFNVPNLVNRVPYGRNAEAIGSTGGATTHTHAGHSNHTVTQPSAHAALSHTGTAVSAHSGTAVADHSALAGHAHETPFIDNGAQTLSTTQAVFGSGTSRTRDWTGSYSAASGSYAVALTQSVSAGTPSAHSVTQPAAHTVTNPSDHAAQSHSGTDVSAHSAHDSPSNMPPYMILNYIIKA
jgi:microcystin-dependent protein